MSRTRQTNANIYNTIVAAAGMEDRLPKMTKENMKDIANKIFTSTTLKVEKNAFIQALINKVGLEILRTSNIKNEFSDFIYYGMEFGDVVEEIFVQPVMGEDAQFSDGLENGQSLDPFRVSKPDVIVNYIRNSVSRVYRMTKQETLLKKAFTNEYGLDRFLGQFVKAVQNGMTNDERNMFKLLLNAVVTEQSFKTINHKSYVDNTSWRVKDKETALKFIKDVKNQISNLLYPTGEYNPNKAIRQLTPNDIVVFVREDILNVIQTELLSSSFHREDLDFTPAGHEGKVKIIPVKDFGGMQAYIPSGSTKQEYKPLKIKYDTFGKEQYYYETDENTPYTDTTVYFANYMDVPSYSSGQNNLPKYNIQCLICDRELPIIAKEEILSSTTYNGEGFYLNMVVYERSTYGFSKAANYILMTEKHELSDTPARLK